MEHNEQTHAEQTANGNRERLKALMRDMEPTEAVLDMLLKIDEIVGGGLDYEACKGLINTYNTFGAGKKVLK